MSSEFHSMFVLLLPGLAARSQETTQNSPNTATTTRFQPQIWCKLETFKMNVSGVFFFVQILAL